MGNQNDTKIVIKWFIPLSNMSLHPKSGFEIDPYAWTRLLIESRCHDQHVIGIIHSHPTSYAIPSTADLQTLWHTIPTHWILSYLHNESPILNAFSFHADGTYELMHWVMQH
jgi:proteasome lid subunit RPN8/RPN11